MWKSDVEATTSATSWNVCVQLPKKGGNNTDTGFDRKRVFALVDPDEEDDHQRDSALKQARTLTSQGVELMEGGNAGEAVKKFEQAAFYAPQDADLQEMRAQALDQLGRAWDAVTAAQAAVDLRPEWPEALATLARCQANMGELTLAVASAQKAISGGLQGDELPGELAAWQALVAKQAAEPALAGQRVPVTDAQ